MYEGRGMNPPPTPTETDPTPTGATILEEEFTYALKLGCVGYASIEVRESVRFHAESDRERDHLRGLIVQRVWDKAWAEKKEVDDAMKGSI